LRAQGTAQDRFRIIDDVAEADMPDFYNSADVCVFPSLGYESLPTVIYEAMATGVPVITQGSWGTPEVLDEVLLSEEELQGEALPATIVELLSDASRREVISRSYQEKVGRFSWDVLEKEYEELYRGVLKGNRFSL
jgi:phosphatidylinositol alpha-mannosyltransferase